MAQTPGFTLVPDAADGIGRHGVGIAWSLPDGGGKTVIIFDPKTYTELGPTTWGAQGQKGTGALLKLAIVNKAGQLPRPRAASRAVKRIARCPIASSWGRLLARWNPAGGIPQHNRWGRGQPIRPPTQAENCGP